MERIFKGISPYSTSPNNFPYMYELKPPGSLYGKNIISLYPLTDRLKQNSEWQSQIGGYINYVSLRNNKC